MSSFTSPLVVEVSDTGKDRLVEPFDFWLGDGEGKGMKITVPAGFETDYASVPRVFRSLLSCKKRAAKPAVVHDYLYKTGIVSRKTADRVFLQAMEVNKVNFFKRHLYYQAVNWFGWFAWRRHRASKK